MLPEWEIRKQIEVLERAAADVKKPCDCGSPLCPMTMIVGPMYAQRIDDILRGLRCAVGDPDAIKAMRAFVGDIQKSFVATDNAN